MKNALTLLISLVITFVLLVYMFLFQVRYDEVTVLTRFGNATEASIKHARPRPYLRWPWPINGVTRYSKRLNLLEDQLEELQTLDGYGIIMRTYVAWRIEDPLKFFRHLRDVSRAEEQLLARIRDARAIISTYEFDQLFNTDAVQIKISEMEQRIHEQLQHQVTDDNYGIKIEQFGIQRCLLPEQVTEQVFEQMRERRQRMAENTRAAGAADALKIVSSANLIRDRILAFAESHAATIRARGDQEAGKYFDVFEQDQDFASFLRRMETMPQLYKDSTVLLPADEVLTPASVLNTTPVTTKPDELVDRN